MEHQIEEGSLYQILHKNLPPKTPIHLKALRAVMVTEKTDMDVTVRFPSASSLKTYFRRVSHKKKNQAPTDSIRPNLDQQFVMGSKVADEVLVRQISSSEFSQQKDHQSFWLVPPRPTGDQVSNSMDRDDQRSNSKSTDDSNNTSSRGMCLSPELKNQLGLLRWGNRRRVTYVGRHKDMNPGFQSSYFSTPPVKEENEVKPTSEGMEGFEMRVTRKRAREISSRNCVMFKGIEELQRRRVAEKVLVKNSSFGKRKSSKEKKREKKLKRRKEKNREMIASGEKVVKLSYDRWSKERYKTAEGKMLMILKEKEAVPGRPILRRILRVEARKHIGDTGLLDHLLKHMAGKVSPNGVDRFRRRHNADGEMEYWLESAELVNIRKEAGVNDPFWIPPPGWEPGDNPSQDPICAKELKLLKEEMAEIKRSMQDLVLLRSKEAAEASGVKEIANVTAGAPLIASSSNINHLQLAQVHNNNSDTSDHDHKLVAVAAATPLKEMCDILMKKKEILEKQLLDITTSLNQFKGEVGKITSTVEEKPMKSTAVVEFRDQKREEEEEEREAKRQRLRSGFRICKPQGTFLWPNMVGGSGGAGGGGSSSTTTVSALSPHQQRSSSSYNQQQQQNHHHHHHHQVVVQVQHEDMNVVPTPPSVSSASSSQLNRLLLTAGGDNGNGRPESPLMKPLAERRAVTVTVTVPGHQHHSQQQQQQVVMEQCGSGDETDNISTTTNSFPRHNPTTANRTRTPHLLIDLNDDDHEEDSSNMDMTNETKGFCGRTIDTTSSRSTVSRHHQPPPPPALLLPQRGGWCAAAAAGGVKEEVVVLDPNSSSPTTDHQTSAATTSRVAHELAKEVLPYKMRTKQELKQQQQQQHIELGLSLGQLGL